ncbi:MAG: phosphomannomutase/phosphoglucomutase, partial [Candidatus Fermentibacteraceae bacterium]|nr:phosphomannomutase/phosphoglucomutase [Candidatus Fermentibacteraceae bacterium]
RVVPLFCDPDGSFPNHHPDPTVVSNLKDLQETVIREECDLGIAFDGDADRLGIVDEKGQVIFGDRILCVLAEALLADNPGATVISEVKASSVFFSQVKSLGGRALMFPTGHSIIKEGMQRENALLAGEMSGHIFFRDRYYGYDDALYAALRFLEIAEKAEAPVSSLTAHLPPVMATPEIREECEDSVKFVLVEKVKQLLLKRNYSVNDTDGVRVEFNNGWGLLRASNTQPVLVMRFEAGTIDQLKEYEEKIRTILHTAREDL